MRWNDINPKIRKLHNAVVTAYSETASNETGSKANDEAWRLMEELTEELKEKA